MGEEDVLLIAERIKAYMEKAQRELPEGISLTIWQDESQDLVDRLEALTKNARSGLMLVLLVLTLFLRFRLALWVAAGIPVALLGTVAMFPLAGISISTMSVMAFILVLGILVDDAIVVGERVYAYEQDGKPRLVAAVARYPGSVFTGVFRRINHHGDLSPHRQYTRPHGQLFPPAGCHRYDRPGFQPD